MPRNNEHAFLNQVLQSNSAAVSFCETLFRISQTLDDIIDGDKSVSGNDVVSAFWQSLIELPANPFYRQHEPYLRPLMASALQDWRDSVAMERADDDHGKHLAFVLRDQLTSVVVQCAYLVGGEAWMANAGPLIRRHFHEDSLDDYLSELAGEEATTPDEDYQQDVSESLEAS